MNELFEEYVGRQVQRVSLQRGMSTKLQSPKRHLAVRDGGDACFELVPDIVLMDDGAPSIVIDTKWKLLKPDEGRGEISTADLYQMFAYARQFLAPSVVLLYPHHPKLGEWAPCRNSFRFNAPNSDELSQRLYVSSLPLVDLKLVPAHLCSILDFLHHNEKVGGHSLAA